MVQKIEKRQLWVRPIEWLKLNFASCVMPYTKKLLVSYWSLWPPMRYDAVARIRVQTSTAFPVIVVAPGTVRPKHWKPENGSTTILTTLAGNVMPVWCSYQGPHVHYIAGHVGVIPVDTNCCCRTCTRYCFCDPTTNVQHEPRYQTPPPIFFAPRYSSAPDLPFSFFFLVSAGC